MMELLSPAGGMEQLRAAARFGADAVYGGLKNLACAPPRAILTGMNCKQPWICCTGRAKNST